MPDPQPHTPQVGPQAAPTAATGLAAFWRSALIHEPELGAVTLDSTARLLSVNDAAAEILLGAQPTVLVGLSLAEVFAAPLAGELRSLVDRVAVTGRTLELTGVFRGVRCRGSMRQIPAPINHILWTIHRAPILTRTEPTITPDSDAVELRAADWGALAPLNVSQRRILGLYAAGLAREQIAALLALPHEDVEIAEMVIEKVLGTSSRAIWALRATYAGLAPA